MVLFLQNNNNIILLQRLFIEDLKEFFIESSKIPVRQTKLIELMYSQLSIVEDPWKNVKVFYIAFDLGILIRNQKMRPTMVCFLLLLIQQQLQLIDCQVSLLGNCSARPGNIHDHLGISQQPLGGRECIVTNFGFFCNLMK
jgi:hypothetical protein